MAARRATTSPSASARFGASCARGAAPIRRDAQAAASRQLRPGTRSRALPWRERPRVVAVLAAGRRDRHPARSCTRCTGWARSRCCRGCRGAGGRWSSIAWRPELELVEGPFQVLRAAAAPAAGAARDRAGAAARLRPAGASSRLRCRLLRLTFAAIAAAGRRPAPRRRTAFAGQEVDAVPADADRRRRSTWSSPRPAAGSIADDRRAEPHAHPLRRRRGRPLRPGRPAGRAAQAARRRSRWMRSSSTARTPPAATASRPRSPTSSSTPVPTSSPWATMSGTSAS